MALTFWAILREAIFTSFPFLGELFRLVDGNQRLFSRIKPPMPPEALAGQYYWFARQHPDTIILAQLGRFCELYAQSALQAKTVLGLKLARNVRGFAVQAGFPMHGLRRAKQRLRQAGLAYIVIAEHGYLKAGLKQRVMTEKCLWPQTGRKSVRV